MSDASFLNIFLRWAPPHEKTRLVVFGFAGAYAGTFINYILCGFLAQNYGVDSIFYVTGLYGTITNKILKLASSIIIVIFAWIQEELEFFGMLFGYYLFQMSHQLIDLFRRKKGIIWIVLHPRRIT